MKLSVCMIVRDEEPVLGRCLEAAAYITAQQNTGWRGRCKPWWITGITGRIFWHIMNSYPASSWACCMAGWATGRTRAGQL